MLLLSLIALLSSTVTATVQCPSSTGRTIVIQVGQSGLTFSPNNVQANVGDYVQFQFHPKAHSVVQAAFAEPCIPIAQSKPVNGTAPPTGFFSGFMPVGANDTMLPTYTVRVNDTKPIWYYCSQAKHCQGGMVGVINQAATGNKTIDAFTKAAAQAAENITPGQASNSTNGYTPSTTFSTVIASPTQSVAAQSSGVVQQTNSASSVKSYGLITCIVLSIPFALI